MDEREFLKRLGLKIKIYRSLKGYSQDDMASLLNIDKSYYSKIERGQANATILYLRKIAGVLDISISEIISSEINI